MKLLAIDTATEALSAALLLNGQVIEHFEIAGREHSTRLPLLVPQLLAPRRLASTSEMLSAACYVCALRPRLSP